MASACMLDYEIETETERRNINKAGSSYLNV